MSASNRRGAHARTPFVKRLLIRSTPFVAKRHKRTKSFLAREALEMYLDEIADIEEALERNRDPNTQYITPNEIRKRLGV